MESLSYLFILFSYSLSLFTIGMAFIIYKQSKKRVIIFFIIFLLGLSLDVLSIGLLSFKDPIIEFIHKIINLGAATLLTFSIPFLGLTLLSQEITRGYKRLILIVVILQLVLNITFLLTGENIIEKRFIKVPMFISIIYTLILTIVYYGTIGDKYLKKVISLILIITVIQMPMMLLNEFILDMNQNRWIIFFISPLLNLLMNLIIIYFTYTFFNQPNYISDGVFTEFFIKKFNLTKREIEVLDFTIKGLTRDKIGEVLFISGNTVNNHIYNIYKKLSVKNRVQLLNLIKNHEN